METLKKRNSKEISSLLKRKRWIQHKEKSSCLTKALVKAFNHKKTVKTQMKINRLELADQLSYAVAEGFEVSLFRKDL